MNKAHHISLLLFAALRFLLGAGTAFAQADEIAPKARARSAPRDEQIRKILREKHNLFLDDFTIIEALRKVATITGVGIEADDDALALLPNGEETRISAKVRDARIGDALAEVLAAVGLVYSVQGGEIKVTASKDLRRFGRRVTWDELKLIGALSKRIDVELDDLTLQVALDKLAELSGAKITLGETANGRSIKQKKVKIHGRGVALRQALNLVCKQTGLSWTTKGDVVYVDTPISIARLETEIRLQRKTQLDYKAATISEILSELSSVADIEVQIEPAAIDQLPNGPNTRLSLRSEKDKKVTLRRAFEFIEEMTGLTFSVEDNKIVWKPSGGARQPSKGLSDRGHRGDKVVGKIVLWSEDRTTSLEIFIYESELPKELRQFKEEKLKQFMEILRERRKPK